MPNHPRHVEKLPVFTNEGPRKNDTGPYFQVETTIGIHPSNRLLAVSGAFDTQCTPNVPSPTEVINSCNAAYTTAHGGNCWSNQCAGSNYQHLYDDAVAWAPNGTSVYYQLETSDFSFSKNVLWRSDNNGQSYTEVTGAKINVPNTDSDLDYIWVDHTGGIRNGA